MTANEFRIGEEVTNSDITQAFGGGPYRAIRVSEEKKSIALLVNYANSAHHDDWRGNVLRFSAFRTVHGPQLDYAPNRRLLTAKSEGYTVLLFERYLQTRGYIFRGEVEVRGVADDSQSSEQQDPWPQNASFLLQPIRHKITSEMVPILAVDIVIEKEETYWSKYFLHQVFELDPKIQTDVTWVTGDIYSSFWRAYATEVLEPFLVDVESTAPGILIPEYQLEHGSIKTTFAVLASVASITGGTMSAVANYPRAKESWPTVAADARSAITTAARALERRFPGVVVLLQSGPNSPQREQRPLIIGLPPSRPSGEDTPVNYLYNSQSGDE